MPLPDLVSHLDAGKTPADDQDDRAAKCRSSPFTESSFPSPSGKAGRSPRPINAKVEHDPATRSGQAFSVIDLAQTAL
jgi:hypothetical protein